MKETEHRVIRTPSDVLNVIGAGGINERTVTELWGKAGSGKSAFAYNTAAMFLEDNPEGVVLIVDSEISTDFNRLENTFKMDLDRVIVEQTKTLEGAYKQIFSVFKKLELQREAKLRVKDFIDDFDEKTAKKLIKDAELDYDLNKIYDAKDEETAAYELQKLANLLAFSGLLKPVRTTPVFIIWDTIAASKPAAEVTAALDGGDPMNAGGLGLRARLNEINMAIVLTHIGAFPVTMFVLNQLRKSGIGGNPKLIQDVAAGQGNSLTHACHYRLAFKSAKKMFDEDLRMNIGTMSKIDVEKSKFGPTVKGIPIWIDDRMGGSIVQREEAGLMCSELGLLNSTGGPWYKFSDDPEQSYTWEVGKLSAETGNYIADNPKVRLRCIDALARHFRKNYFLLDIVYKKIGLKQGELTEQDRLHRENLVSNVSVKSVLNAIDAEEEDSDYATSNEPTPYNDTETSVEGAREEVAS